MDSARFSANLCPYLLGIAGRITQILLPNVVITAGPSAGLDSGAQESVDLGVGRGVDQSRAGFFFFLEYFGNEVGGPGVGYNVQRPVLSLIPDKASRLVNYG